MKYSFIKKIQQINITRANIQDLQDWVNILYNSLKDTYSGYISSEYMDDNYNIKQLQSNFLQDLSIENSSTELYMLKINSEAVGILKIGKPIKYYSDGHNYYKDDVDDVGEIKSLHIRRDFQSQGIGSQAIAFAENRLRRLGYSESSIWVKMQNTNAINFYTNRGYVKTNYINPNTKDKAPSVIMEKKLRILAQENEDKEKTI
ncbi:MAG: GNAT family N-acetyltransferase [Clostridia bacterium]|nr:GNAT family N-acetyltransferase [Clostridia bacterium]